MHWIGEFKEGQARWTKACRAAVPLLVLFGSLVFCPWSSGRAEAGDDIPEPPVAGRPEFFEETGGAIGAFQVPVVQPSARELQAEDPFTLSIRITAAGRVQRPPHWPQLEKLPGFSEAFYIEPYPAEETGRQVDGQTWEFTYTLRPKNTKVKAVPSFPFVFFTPGFLPPEAGYQVKRARGIELTVRPRKAVSPEAVKSAGPPAETPDFVYRISRGPEVLHRSLTWTPRTLLTIGIIGLLVPPMLCIGWCLLWRRLFPDALHRARKQRSQAARFALRALNSQDGDREPGERAAAIVTDYLHQRLDLPAAEPTPREVGISLQRAGLAPGLTDQAAAFFRACDAARFSLSTARAPDDLRAAATKLILSLEAEPWPSPMP
jgi:hypothetical protein